MTSERVAPRARRILASLVALYGLAFVLRTSFVVPDGPTGATRVFALFDDTMVSMRYARHWIAGHGLVWNAGDGALERVEGFTNPLWVLLMAGAHLLPLGLEHVSLPIQLLGVGLLVASALAAYRLALAIGASERGALAALGLTGFYLPLVNWCAQGTEVSALALLVALACRKALPMLGSDSEFRPAVYGLGALASLVRPDGAVPGLILWGSLLALDGRHRRQHVLWGGLVLGAALGVQTGLRLWYYGDPLPNTYYLKMTGFPDSLRIARGALVLLETLWRMNWILFLLPCVLLAARPKLTALQRRTALLLGLVFLGQCAYSIYVGGDAWEWWGGANRYVALAMPLYFALFAAALESLVSHLGRSVPALRRPGAFLGICVMSAATFSLVQGPITLYDWLLRRRPPHVEDNRDMYLLARELEALTTPDATIALSKAGVLPYFLERHTIDLLGKSDRRIARLEARYPPAGSRFQRFWPGHMKWDSAYSIGERKPDVVTELWRAYGDARPWLERDYVELDSPGHSVWLRRGSARLLWDRIPLRSDTPGAAAR